MSINPIELLKQKVTPVFLNDQDGLTSPKNALLSRFYPIFLSILMVCVSCNKNNKTDNYKSENENLKKKISDLEEYFG